MASGSGSNAEAIVKYYRNNLAGLLDFTVVCNRTPEVAGVYSRMEKFQIKTKYLPSPNNDFSKVANFLKLNRFDLIALAGYMRILPPEIVAQNNIINIHPSLLPFKYQGSKDAYQDTIDNGDKIAGCTVHRVTADVDAGPRLAQIAFEIPDEIVANKDVDALKEIGLAHEHALYPAVVGNQIFGDKLPLNLVAIYDYAKQLATERKIPHKIHQLYPTVFTEYPCLLGPDNHR
jgi:phosphoribosylglycinamide formyltransferase-1